MNFIPHLKVFQLNLQVVEWNLKECIGIWNLVLWLPCNIGSLCMKEVHELVFLIRLVNMDSSNHQIIT